MDELSSGAMLMISVVIPAYNAASTILRAISAALAQDTGNQELEIIVVDDGSMDATGILVEAYAKLSRQTIRLYHQVNLGPAAARNLGVAMSQGGYIAFLDADDYWLPGKLRAQLKVLERNLDTALVCTPRNRRRFAPATAEFLIDFHSLLWSNRVYTSSVVVRKQAFEAVGGFNPERRLSEDYELWLKIAAKGSLTVLNEPFLEYAEGAGLSSSLWHMEKGELETYRIIREAKLISGFSYLAVRGWSIAKYLRRSLKRPICTKQNKKGVV